MSEKAKVDALLEKQDFKCGKCDADLLGDSLTGNIHYSENMVVCLMCSGHPEKTLAPTSGHSVIQSEKEGNTKQNSETALNAETVAKPKNDRMTVPKKENILPFQDVYQWATLLTGEATKFEFDFVWTSPMKALLRKLRFLNSQLVAVIGLQGTGKTEFLRQLETELRRQIPREKRVAAIRLANFNIEDFLNIMNMDALTQMFKRRFKQLYPDKESMGGLHASKDPIYRFNWYRKKLGKHANEIIEEYMLAELAENYQCVFIDLGDYDKKNRSRMNSDLKKLRDTWLKIAGDDYSESTVNFVYSMQKELFTGNFTFGKPIVFELKPFSPQQLVDFYKNKFESVQPFTEEALFRIAQLSMGIWRRYKKYVATCLDKWYDLSDQNPSQKTCHSVILENVEQWITSEQLAKDMELEFFDIFPTNKMKQRKAMMICQQLQKGAMKQTDVTKKFFGKGNTAEKACGRMLEVLEAHGKISRSLEGTRNTKIVSLKGGE